MISRRYLRLIAVLILISVVLFSFNMLLYFVGAGSYLGVGCGDSMEPNYQTGDIMLYTSSDNIEKGDVVRVDLGEEELVHRVVEVNRSSSEPYKVKGDNNEQADGWFNEQDIKGKLVTNIGTVSQFCMFYGTLNS